ncbi:hypothetical protein KP509_37G030700 [Ceratopteris richardii]|uniref:Uncharacterized protein n=1 Tax=Ceratopteris richardii TaxID=49495 RepID=A0A8T2Q7R7_CERRI|nr:hypothetical protein KP509_37G030700 [Ceratopteris richardii]
MGPAGLYDSPFITSSLDRKLHALPCDGSIKFFSSVNSLQFPCQRCNSFSSPNAGSTFLQQLGRRFSLYNLRSSSLQCLVHVPLTEVAISFQRKPWSTYSNLLYFPAAT